MNLSPGARFGPYEIVAAIGAGGMGEVYRARDTRLKRDVALKILPDVFARDPERLARFQREAEVLASLNHPHIAAIHGLEESGGIRALVLELVEGETLADRVALGPIPVNEALPLAKQIAEALETAHEHGVIHRDLKPANIKITSDRVVKVLDFGLAKALEADSASAAVSNSPTIALAATRTGVILGTAAYMAPEQAKGRPVDRRADIWAFGVVLAEMLTGRRLFPGETVSETLASVMKDEPVIPDAPPAVRDLLRRCLHRDPRQRLRDIGEARIVLEDPSVGDWRGLDRGVTAAPTQSRTFWWASAVAVVAIVAAIVSWRVKPAPPTAETPLRKFNLPIEKLQSSIDQSPQISPDGTRIVYSSNGKLWIRDLDALEPRELVASGDPRNYFWSPDSSQVAYIAGDRLWRVAASGGQPAVVTVLRQALGSGVGATWEPDGRIVFTTAMPGTGLQRVSSSGGDFSTLVPPEPGMQQDFHDVSSLPEGKGLLYALDRGSGVVDTIIVFANETKKTILHLDGESLRAPRYSPTGHIVYERTTNNPGIWALPFALDELTVTAEPFLVSPQGGLPSVSRDGTLLYVRQPPASLRELVWVNRAGAVQATIGQPQQGLADPAVSPDGRHVAVSAGVAGQADIWVYDTVRGSRTRLTFAEGDERQPAWSPSGEQIFFSRSWPPGARPSISSQVANGTGQMELVVEQGRLPAVSRDGKVLAFDSPGKEAQKTEWDLSYVALHGDRTPVRFVEAPTIQSQPRFSPDGRYLAYTSLESGRVEVYLKAFPSGDGKWQVSVNGGNVPRWSGIGDKLFYVERAPGSTEPKVLEVDVVMQPFLRLGTPRVLFTATGAVPAGWDVSPDGQRFIYLREVPNPRQETPALTVVENWFAEFKNRQVRKAQ